MSLTFHRLDDQLGFAELAESGSTSNIYVVGPADNCLLVDCGSAFAADELIATLCGQGVRPGGVKAIIVTHGHGDHFGGGSALSHTFAAPVWAHVAAAGPIEDRRGTFITPSSHSQNTTAADWQRYCRVAGPGVAVQRLLREGDSIEHAGLRLNVMHTPGHERGQITLHEPTRGWVFVGDAVQGGFDAAGNWLGLFSDFASQRTSLARIAALGSTLLLKGHRRPRTGDEIAADLASAAARVARIEQVVLEALKAGAPLSLATVTRAAFRGVLDYLPDSLPNYALHSVQAMLLDLGQRGLARRNHELDWEPI